MGSIQGTCSEGHWSLSETGSNKRLLRQTKVAADRILTGKSRGLPAVNCTPKTLLLLRRVNSKQLGKYPRHFCFVNQSYVCPSLQCLITLFKLVTKIRKVILYSPKNPCIVVGRSAPRNLADAKDLWAVILCTVLK